MTKIFKTILTFLAGVAIFLIGGAVLSANDSLNNEFLGGSLMFVGLSISILSGIFEAKTRKK